MNYVNKSNGFAVTVLSETPNSVTFAPKGGGFVYRIPKALFQADFNPEEVKEPTWRKAWFTWDGAEQKWEGYTAGQHWNGWELPLFTLEVAQDIAALTQAEEGDRIVYDPDNDCFIHTNCGDTEGYPQLAPSVLIEGRYVRLYAVADGWCWEEARDQPARKIPDYFSLPITGERDAELFLQFLYEDGLLFHPEDDPAEVSNYGVPLFTDDEVGLLRSRMREVHWYLNDPCAWALWLDKRFEITWVEGYGEYDGTSEEHPASWFNEDKGFAADDQRAMDETLVGDTLHLGAPWALVSIRRIQ